MLKETITVGDGKYTVILKENGIEGFEATRNGEEWRSLIGDGLILAMFYRIQELEEESESKTKAINDLKTKLHACHQRRNNNSEPKWFPDVTF